MKYVKDKDGLEMCKPERGPEQRVDPSVYATDLYLEGEPRGSVPMDVTIGKPRAYYPAKSGPK